MAAIIQCARGYLSSATHRSKHTLAGAVMMPDIVRSASRHACYLRTGNRKRQRGLWGQPDLPCYLWRGDISHRSDRASRLHECRVANIGTISSANSMELMPWQLPRRLESFLEKTGAVESLREVRAAPNSAHIL
jgi:hypothetical protein